MSNMKSLTILEISLLRLCYCVHCSLVYVSISLECLSVYVFLFAPWKPKIGNKIFFFL